MSNSETKNIAADIGLFYAAAIWGSTFFIVKNALAGIDPVVLVAYRFLTAGVVLLGYLLYKKKNIFAHLKSSLFLAVILFFLYASQTIGLGYTTASNSGFITGLFVFFIPLFQLILFKVQPTKMEITACVISLTGLWILTGGLHDINIGDMLTLIAAVTYALHVLYSDKYIRKNYDPLVLSCQQFLMVGVMSLIAALLFDLPLGIHSGYALYATLFLALFPTLSAFVIQMYAQKIRTPLRVSLIFALEPVFAALFAWTLGNEAVVTHRAIGGFLIFLALLLSGIPLDKIRKKRISRT